MDSASDSRPERLKLVYFPDKKLNEKSHPIIESIPDSKNLQNLIKSMYLTMEMSRGIGLSAIQVGVPLALFVLNVNGKKQTVINPSITKLDTEENSTFEHEGCLSMPYVSTRIRRPAKIEVSFFDETGKNITTEYDGLMARAFCHEYDHLQGITMYDKVDSISKQSLMKKVKKVEKILGKLGI